MSKMEGRVKNVQKLSVSNLVYYSPEEIRKGSVAEITIVIRILIINQLLVDYLIHEWVY